MDKSLFQTGDVIRRGDTDECRVIFSTHDDMYWYVDYSLKGKTFFLNPTASAHGQDFMNSKFHKIGVVDNIGIFRAAVIRINTLHSTAFAEADKLFSKHKVILENK